MRLAGLQDFGDLCRKEEAKAGGPPETATGTAPLLTWRTVPRQTDRQPALLVEVEGLGLGPSFALGGWPLGAPQQHPPRLLSFPQAQLGSKEFGKHLLEVEDLLQKHSLLEADISAQAERVQALNTAALKFSELEGGWGLGWEGVSLDSPPCLSWAREPLELAGGPWSPAPSLSLCHSRLPAL